MEFSLYLFFMLFNGNLIVFYKVILYNRYITKCGGKRV